MGLLIQGLTLNSHSFLLPRLRQFVVLRKSIVLCRSLCFRPTCFFAVITSHWQHFWFPGVLATRMCLGCLGCENCWRIFRDSSSLIIFHPNMHLLPTISGSSKHCIFWLVLLTSLPSILISPQQQKRQPQTKSLWGRKEWEGKVFSFISDGTLVPTVGAEAMNLDLTGRKNLPGWVFASITHPEGVNFLFLIWKSNDSMQTLHGEICFRAWGPPLAWYFNLIFRPAWFHWVRGKWALLVPSVDSSEQNFCKGMTLSMGVQQGSAAGFQIQSAGMASHALAKGFI